MIEPGWQGVISAEGKHHPAVACQREEPTVPHTNDDDRHQHYCAVITKDVHKDLQHGLGVITINSPVEILDREKQTQKVKETKDCRTPD